MREEIAHDARSDESMTTYDSCVPDDEKISSPEAGQRRFWPVMMTLLETIFVAQSLVHRVSNAECSGERGFLVV